jgi:aminopeptidase N
MIKIITAILSIMIPYALIASEADSIWKEGLNNFRIENYHGFIKNLNEFLKIKPGNSVAIYNRGLARIKLGDIDNACMDFLSAKSAGFRKNTKFIKYYCDPSYKLKFLKKYFYRKEELFRENGYRPEYSRADTLRGATRPERNCFDVYFYDLTVRIIPKGKQIRGHNDIYFTMLDSSEWIQIDLFDNYTINKIQWKGQILNFKREFNAVFVRFPDILAPREKHIITVEYYGRPGIAKDPPWKGGFVWKKDKKNNKWVAVACEHLGASSWWPNKDHLSDEPDSMRINIEVPENYKAISNGVLKRIEKTDNLYDRFVWFVSYPINNYNVTFYMGRFIRFNDTLVLDNDTLHIKYYVLPHNLEKARQHFKQTPEILKFYSGVFGQYPFIRDGFGLVEAPYAGMEHQTAIAYGNSYSNDKNDHAYRNKQYDYIIVHEAAHEWWGNSVSAGDMADVWIHEGFATYAELLFIENVFGKEEYLYEIMRKSFFIYNFWPMVQNRNVNENSFASNDIYNKGAIMLHSLRCTINNDSLFFRIIKDFCIKNRYKIVYTDDFIEFVNKETKENYSAFFNKYLFDNRLPVLEYSFYKNPDDLIFKYKWTEVEDGFKMPFCIETSEKKAIRLLGTTQEQEIELKNTSWFNFFNKWKGIEGVRDNSFTYFWTSYKE